MSQGDLFGSMVAEGLQELSAMQKMKRDAPLDYDLLIHLRMARVQPVLPDTIEAGDAWGANCGPMSLAAVLGLPTVQATRPLVEPFKGFMSPTNMQDALRRAKRHYIQRALQPGSVGPWPVLGLVRIQWEGPWLGPEVNPQAAYRYTHWVGVRRGLPPGDDRLGPFIEDDAVLVYDATPNVWMPLAWWEAWAPSLYPKRATGWHPVTRIDTPPRGPARKDMSRGPAR